MERTAEYQMSAQKDFYIQNLKSLRGEMEALLGAREAELSATRQALKVSEAQSVAAASQHKTDVADLNATWRTNLERKMHEGYVALERKVEELAAVKTQAALELKTASEAAAAELAKSQQEAAQREQALQTRIAELELALRESESSYEEALEQMESEHDVQVVGLEQSSALARARTREGTAILCAEVSAAKRKLEEKNEAWKALEALSNEREDQLQHLAGVIRRLTSEMTGLKVGLREKEEHITRRQHELAQARQDNGTLKNFLEILSVP
jgi:chromosome segregation ATPase